MLEFWGQIDGQVENDQLWLFRHNKNFVLLDVSTTLKLVQLGKVLLWKHPKKLIFWNEGKSRSITSKDVQNAKFDGFAPKLSGLTRRRIKLTGWDAFNPLIPDYPVLIHRLVTVPAPHTYRLIQTT